MEKSVIDKVVNNITKNTRLKMLDIRRELVTLQSAETVVEMMQHKLGLLIKLYDLLPLGPGECPYCAENSYYCELCKYAEIHGKCTKIGSLYDKIILSLQRIIEHTEYLYGVIHPYAVVNETMSHLVKSTIENKLCKLEADISLLFRVMENVESVEYLMHLKSDMMRCILSNLPLGASTCYYCQIFEDCDECPIGKVHNPCSQPYSRYKKLEKEISHLKSLIETYSKV